MIGIPGTTSGCSGGGVFSDLGEIYGIVVGGRCRTIENNMSLSMHFETLERKLGEPSFSHIVPALYLFSLLPKWRKIVS